MEQVVIYILMNVPKRFVVVIRFLIIIDMPQCGEYSIISLIAEYCFDILF